MNTWGGRRPGAGAPKGNFNALRHGRRSPRLTAYIRAVASDPALQKVIAEVARVGDMQALVRYACRDVDPVAFTRQRKAIARRQSLARAARKIERLIARVPRDRFDEPPPVLILDDDGNPYAHHDERTGAPFNPVTGEHERIDPRDPATLHAARRRVYRAIRRRHDRDLIEWAVRQTINPQTHPHDAKDPARRAFSPDNQVERRKQN